MAEKETFPTIPEGNWWQIRDQFKKTMPTKVTISYLKSLLGLTSDGSARNLIRPLLKLGIIDDKGNPTELAVEWRSDEKYPSVCQKMLENTFSKELRDLFSGEGIDREKLKTWFKDNHALGEVAANKNAQMYILLDNKMPLKYKEKKKTGKKVKAKSSSDTDSTKESKNIEKKKEVPTKKEKHGATQDTPSVHINLQIHISADANDSQIEKIFKSISEYLYNKP